MGLAVKKHTTFLCQKSGANSSFALKKPVSKVLSPNTCHVCAQIAGFPIFSDDGLYCLRRLQPAISLRVGDFFLQKLPKLFFHNFLFFLLFFSLQKKQKKKRKHFDGFCFFLEGKVLFFVESNKIFISLRLPGGGKNYAKIRWLTSAFFLNFAGGWKNMFWFMRNSKHRKLPDFQEGVSTSEKWFEFVHHDNLSTRLDWSANVTKNSVRLLDADWWRVWTLK